MTETFQVDEKILSRIDMLLSTAQNALSACLIIRRELESVSTETSKNNSGYEEKLAKVMAKCSRIREGKKLAKIKKQ